MKLCIFILSAVVGVAFTAWIINLLKGLAVLLVPPLANFTVLPFIVAFAMLFGIVLLLGKIIEHCAVEYPYDDRM